MQYNIFALAPHTAATRSITSNSIFSDNAVYIDLMLFRKNPSSFKDNMVTNSFILGNAESLFKSFHDNDQIIKEKFANLVRELEKIDKNLYEQFMQDNDILYNWIILSLLINNSEKNNLISFLINKIELDLKSLPDYSKKGFYKLKNKLPFILAELLKNAFIHGNKCDLSKDVYVAWKVSGNRFILTIGDHGTNKVIMEQGKFVFAEKKTFFKTLQSYLHKFTLQKQVQLPVEHFLFNVTKSLELTGKHWGIDMIFDKYGGIITSEAIKLNNSKQIGKMLNVSLFFENSTEKHISLKQAA